MAAYSADGFSGFYGFQRGVDSAASTKMKDANIRRKPFAQRIEWRKSWLY
jgi:hypothetical protein